MPFCNLVTSNPSEVVMLNWTIQNFRLMDKIVISPIIHPIPNCGEEWIIALRFIGPNESSSRKILDIFLSRNNSCIKEYYVELESLKICGYYIGIHSPIAVVCIRKGTLNVLHSSYFNQVLNKNDNLIVNAELTVSGYHITSSSSPRPEIDFRDNQDLSQDLERSYGDSTTADITFLVEEQKLFAHSIVIRCRSTVFDKMLDQDMLESSSRCICITDSCFHVFDCFLMYLYTAKLKNGSWDTIYNLYYLAEKYAVSGLKKTCSRCLGANLSMNTVSKCIALAALHEDLELKEMAKQFIRDNLFNVLESSDWKYIVSNDPKLASEVLSFVTSPWSSDSANKKSL